MLTLKDLGSWTLLFIFGSLLSFQVSAQKDLVISGGNTVSSFVCENRTAYVWGSNKNGQLGVGSGATSISVPTAVPIPGNPDVKQINSGSGAHFVALTCGGDVWAWGANDNGQIGTGSSSGMNGVITTPTRVLANAAIPATNRNASGQLINAVVVYSGTSNTFAILNDGKLVSWGLNSGGSAGQLGQGNTTDAYTANYVLAGPAPGTPLTGVIQIFAGDNVAYALVDPDGDGVGTVYSWGNGLNGTLGRNAAGTGNPSTATTNDGNTVQDNYARPVYYVDGTQMNNIQQLQAGDVFGIALDVNNYIWTWGNGGWNSSTGNVNNANTSAPRKVVAGSTTGASNDGLYLLAKAIGGGQGYGMAVTVDGKPVAWGGGGCGSGGATGNGTLTGSSAGPQYIQYGAGLVHNNVTLINRGDLWGFYGTSNNDFYAWGCNSFGQLGIGNTTDQPYAAKITPPSGCDFRDPAPFADLHQNDISVCQTTFNPPGLVLNSGFTILASIASKYTITWKRNGSQVKTGTAATASNLTYTATQDGTYSVEISYTGANAGCQVYDVATDKMTITYFTPSFTVLTGLTFCGTTATVNVNSTNAAQNPVYAWYPTAASTTELGRTIGSGSTTISTATLTGTTTKTVYVEEIRQKKGVVFPNAQVSSTLVDGSGVEGHDSYIETTTTLSLDSLTIFLRSYSGTATFTGKVQIYGNKSDCGSKTVADKSNVLYQSAVFNVSTTSTTFVPINIPVGITLPAGKYFIGYTAGPTNGTTAKLTNVAGMTNGGAVLNNNTPISDNIGGTYVKFYGSDEGDCFGSSGYAGYNSNFQFSIPQGYCNRLPVTLTEACPCSKPSVVTITTPAAATVTLCQNTAQTLSGTVTVTATAKNTAFHYSWIKMGATPATDAVLQTAVIALVVNTPTAVPDYIGITGTVAQAGKYILRVEDGNVNSASCFRDDTLTLVVNATTTAGAVAGTQTICTGGNPSAFTSTTAGGGGDGTTYAYQWESDAATTGTFVDIALATNATYDEGVLTNAGTTAKVITYRRKVKSGVCPQVTATAISITVNPAVVVGVVAADQTICSSGDPAAFTVTTATTGGSGTYTYQWESAVSPFSSYTAIGSATNATYDAPTGLAATTKYRRIDGSGTCTTVTTASITVTIQPALTAGAVATDQTICYNTAASAFTSTTAAAGGTGTFAYQWQSSNTNSGFADIALATNATYTDATLLTADKYYVRKVTSGALAGCNTATTTSIHVTVSPNFVVGSIGNPQTVCQTTGDPTTLTSVSLPTGGQTAYTYQWQSSLTTGTGFGNIASATNATYDPPAGLTATTYFRRVDKSAGTCGTLNTNEVIVTITPTVTPSVTIATPSTTICTGTSVTFTATPTSGGAAPTYQWFKGTPPSGGTSLGAASTNNTYTTTAAANNDSYYVVMTSNAACPSPATAASTAIVMAVTTIVTPAVTIAVAPGTTICAGASITFTATAGNGGSAPTYQWFKGTPPSGGASLGAASTNNTYTTTTAANNDSYYVIMTSNSSCVVAPGTATSTAIVMTVNPNLTPAVTIAVNPTTAICAGASLTFTATPTNGGTPTYQWFKGTPPSGGTSLGAASTNNTYTTTAAANNDSYYVVMTSTATCASPTTATSTAIVTTVNPILVPSVTIAASPTTICTNGSTTFTATPTNPGAAPTYEWFINNVSKSGPAATATFSTTALIASSDVVKVTLTSNALCALPTTASASMSVTVNTGIGSGTIGITTATICYNTIPGAITQTVAPTGIAGTPTYTWEASPTGLAGSFITIPAATNSSYTATIAITQDAYIRRVITDPGTPTPCNVATSNTIHIIVNAQLVAGVIAGNETTCANVSTATITSTSLPTGGTGSYTYQWKSSATAGGPYTNIGGATNATYSPGIVATTTYFVRVETSGTCGNVTSNEITKTVNPVLVPSVTIAASPTTICTNGSTTFTATPTNPGAAPLYEWFVKGVSQGSPAGSATFSTTALTLSTDVVKVTLTSNALCATPATASASMSVTVNTGIGSGTIGITTSTICYNTIPGTITQTVAPINIAGSPTYTWEASATGLAGSFITIPAATNISYTATIAITQDAYIRRVITDPGTPAPCNVATSNTIHIIVNPQLVAGVIGSDETMCSGAVPLVMTQTTAPTGGTGTYTYQWQSDASGSFQNIAGATNTSYTSGALTATTQFQLIATSGTCGSITSNIVTKTITTPETVTVSINDPGQVCAGSAAFTFTAAASTTGTGTLSYAWDINGPVGTNSSTYTYNPVIGDAGKVVKVVVTTSNGCNTGPATSNLVTLDIVGATTPTVAITANNNPNCAGLQTTFTATSTGGGGSPTYQWYVIPFGGSATAVGSGGTSYTTATLGDKDQVYVELTSSLTCLTAGVSNPFPSNKITMTIKPIPAPTITEGDQTVCSPATFTFHATVGTGTTLQWKLNNIDIAGATNSSFTASQTGSYTLYEDNGTCNSTSAPVILNVIQTPVANAGSDIFIKKGEAGNLNGSGGAVYSWSPATYLNSTIVSNPNFTATETITYTLTVSDATSTCSSTDDVTVYVVSPIEVPNVITVNGDGTNDDWEIKNIEGYPNVIIEIYNRWGNLVWKTEGYPKNWDGTNFRNGQVLPDGTYFYIINLHSQVYDEPLTGWVQIIK